MPELSTLVQKKNIYLDSSLWKYIMHLSVVFKQHYFLEFFLRPLYYCFNSFVQHTPLEKLDKKHFPKGSRGSEQNGIAAALQQNEDWKEIALMESKMEKLCDLLEEVSLCSVLIFLKISFNTVVIKCKAK